jgi:ABC-type uncharacterized transport system
VKDTRESAITRLFGSLFFAAFAACVLATVINLAAVRFRKRFDVTVDQRYSLSPATQNTLRTLPEPVHAWLLLAKGDPLRESVSRLLAAYEAESPKFQVHRVDPDVDPAAYLEIRRKYRIGVADSKSAGDIMNEIAAVVTLGEQHWFVSVADLIEVEPTPNAAQAGSIRPREEKAVTAAVRNLLGGPKATLCFTTGHGEADLHDLGREGISFLVDILEKDNYVVRAVDPTVGQSQTPFENCAVVIVGGLASPYGAREAERLKTYALSGGNVLIAVGPILAPKANAPGSEMVLSGPGIESTLAAFGIEYVPATILEANPARAMADSDGVAFFASPLMHPVTTGLSSEEGSAKSVFALACPLKKTTAPEGMAASPASLLTTSAESFATQNLKNLGERALTRNAADLAGPFTVAMASERPKTSADAAHGPRMVVIGDRSALSMRHWQAESGANRGTAVVVQNAIAWLSAKPQVLDLPNKSLVSVRYRFTAENAGAIRQYVVFYIPGAALCFALFLFAWRRSKEDMPWKSEP